MTLPPDPINPLLQITAIQSQALCPRMEKSQQPLSFKLSDAILTREKSEIRSASRRKKSYLEELN